MPDTRNQSAAREVSYKAWYANQSLDTRQWLFAIANLCFKLTSDTTTFKFMADGENLSEIKDNKWWSRASGQAELSSQLGSSVESFALHNLAVKSATAGNRPTGDIAEAVHDQAPPGDNALGTRNILGGYVSESIYSALGTPQFTFDDLEQQAKETTLMLDDGYNAFADWLATTESGLFVGELKTRWPATDDDGRTIALDPKAVVQSFQQARLYYDKNIKTARPMLVYMCCPFPGTAARVAVFMPSLLASVVLSAFQKARNFEGNERCIQLAAYLRKKVSDADRAGVLEELAASPVRLAVDNPSDGDAKFTCGSLASQRLALEVVDAVRMTFQT